MEFRLPKKERISPHYSRKISEVLFEFAAEIAPTDSPPPVFAEAVDVAVILWNLGLLPEGEQRQGMLRLRRELMHGGSPPLQLELERLLEIRQTRYGDDRRLVAHYELTSGAKGPRLTVASLDTKRPGSRPA
jgi:hypothetical protein